MNRRHVIFYFIMICTLIVSLEITLQAAYYVSNGGFLFERVVLPLYEPDEYRGYKMKPDLKFKHKTNEFNVTYFTNVQGIRTDRERRDFLQEKSEGIYRVLFFGPSFTFGWANDYENIYSTIIGQNLKVRGKDVEVMNLGTPAQPVPWQLCWLKSKGFKFSPDMVVITVYLGIQPINHVCHELKDATFVIDGYLSVEKGNSLIGYGKNSAIVFYGWYLFQILWPYCDRPIGLGDDFLDRRYSEVDSAFRLDGIVQLYQQHVEFIQSVVGRDIPVIFIHIPVSYVVRPSDLSRWRHLGNHDPVSQFRSMTQIQRALEGEGIISIDPTLALTKADRKTRMYHFLDIHLTAKGNRVVADTSIPIIQKIINLSD